MSNINLNRVYAGLAARGSTPQISIQSHAKLGASAFKVVASTFGVDNEADFSAAIASITEGRGRVIPGSFNQRGRISVAVVAANAQSKPLDASFQVMTASTALAADGRIWNVVDDNGNKRVVLESCDDLGEILKARQAARAVHANPVEGAGLAVASVGDGDLVRYVDVSTNTAAWGFAVRLETGNLSVVDNSLEPKTIVAESVIASVPGVLKVTAKLEGDKLSTMLEYLKKAWAPGPQTDAMIEKYRKMAEGAR